ncbi:MAG: VCBS repeat-containing protein [Myxococcales bacterium]|nr:VCBS repeat-containing protein [Myxococcales bacterium]
MHRRCSLTIDALTGTVIRPQNQKQHHWLLSTLLVLGCNQNAIPGDGQEMGADAAVRADDASPSDAAFGDPAGDTASGHPQDLSFRDSANRDLLVEMDLGMGDLANLWMGDLSVAPTKDFGAFDAAIAPACLLFNPPVVLPPSAHRVLIADFNGDKKPDLIAEDLGGNLPSNIAIFVGDGEGKFAAPLFAAVGQTADSFDVGDFNADGILDVAAGNFEDDTVSILRGKGNGTFQPQVTYPTGRNPVEVIAADLRKTGVSDLIIVDQNINDNGMGGATGFDVLLGTGKGTFMPLKHINSSSSLHAAVGDLNGDGWLDVAQQLGIVGKVGLYYGDGQGGFTLGPELTVGPVEGVTVADVKQDGKMDILSGERGNVVERVFVSLGKGKGTFGLPQPFTTGRSPYRIRVVDMDGDGKLDMVVSNFNGKSISTLKGDGLGGFGPHEDCAVGGLYAADFSVGDLNGDGKPDVAVGNANSVVLLFHK